MTRLKKKGVDARGSIAHNMSNYKVDGAPRPHLKRLATEVVSMPIYPKLRKDNLAYIISACNLISDELGT
jgi:dTDP-4-amino-4,6-dideoxygalactose transaminase